MEDKIGKVMTELRDSLGGAGARLVSVNEGVVTIEYSKPVSYSSTCHPDTALVTKDIVLEVVEDKLGQEVPEVKKVVIIDAE